MTADQSTDSSASAQAPSELSLRVAGLSDLDAIDAIEAESFVYDRFPRRNLARMLASPTASFVLVEIGGVPAGYAAVLFRSGTKVARLYSIAVAPAFRGRHVAKRLLDQSEAIATRHGRERMRLEFRSSNVQAQRLYERSGYAVIASKPEYYGDGETAIRMEKRLIPSSTDD
jgi:ribosomal-protein-alanine acetyltransferase